MWIERGRFVFETKELDKKDAFYEKRTAKQNFLYGKKWLKKRTWKISVKFTFFHTYMQKKK
jgi:hypothetical protein